MKERRSKDPKDSEKTLEKQREVLYCQRRGFTHILPGENPLRIKPCEVPNCPCYELRREWWDHIRYFRHDPSGTIVLTCQPYMHQDLRQYQKLARRVWAFAMHNGLRHRVSLVESWYLPNHTCLIELWREKKALL